MLSRARRIVVTLLRAPAPLGGSALTLAFLFGAATAAAQQPTARDSAAARVDTGSTHTVKRGDTLWDIARQYLGDPFQWPELYRANREVVEDPHWIYPGEVLKIPGRQVAQAPEPAQADTTPVASPDEPTVFGRPEPAAQPAARRTIERHVEQPASTVRVGEYIAAPFMDRRGGPTGTGRIIETADIPGIAQAANRARLQIFDEVRIEPPAGTTVKAGDRFVAYILGPAIEDVGQVVRPTGVVEVSRPGAPGVAAVARVLSLFGEMQVGQRLTTYDTSVASVTAQPQPVSTNLVGSVRWIAGDPVLPSVGQFLIVDIASREGIRPGDQFQLFRPRVEANAEQPVAQPEVAIATAQAIRVTDNGTTLLVETQDQPAIELKTPARVTAKMP